MTVSDVYRLARAASTRARASPQLSDGADVYGGMLKHFTSIAGVDKHAALLILILCLRPSRGFNHGRQAVVLTQLFYAAVQAATRSGESPSMGAQRPRHRHEKVAMPELGDAEPISVGDETA